ncbi:MAG: hypothetical protein RR315_01130 [Oscillospiraceae bacterium]
MSKFVIVLQNAFTNALAHYKPIIMKWKDGCEIVYGGAIGGERVLFESNTFPWCGINTRILDLSLIKLNSINNDEDIHISTKEYSSVCGISRQTAREQLNKYAPLLGDFIVDGWEKDEDEDESGEALCSVDVEQSGVYICFSSCVINKLKSKEGKGNVMPFPISLFKISNKLYPNSYSFGRKITEHKFMNVGKSNQDTISIKTLVNACQTNFGRSRKDGHFVREIRVPFERDMNALSDILTWCYMDTLDIDADAEPPKNYNEFLNTMIKIKWLEYPNDMKLIQNRIEKNTKTPAKRSKKNRPPP